MKTKRDVLREKMGKGGLDSSTFKQVSSPINLLKFKGSPPIAAKIPNTKDNYTGKKLTK